MKLLLLLLLSACSSREPVDYIDAGYRDSQTTGPPICNPEFVDNDFYHCGACDNHCPSADSDRCINGICHCGILNTCNIGSDCRIGRCVPVDPEGMPCEFDSWCYSGYVCIEGHCSFLECVPEVCDGFDNDCDGIVDNSSSGPLAQWCLGDTPVDPRTTVLPPCAFGIRTCQSGVWAPCEGGVFPVPETGLFSCDSIDNDCDGCTDGILVAGVCTPSDPAFFDVVFILDISGSMDGIILNVKDGMRMFSSRYATSSFRFALVLIGAGWAPETGEIVLGSDFVPYAVFDTELTSITNYTGSIESSRDATYYVGTETVLPLSWLSDSARIVILITDEVAQSRLRPPIDEPMMCGSLTHGEVFIVVTKSSYFGQWGMCSYRLIDIGHPADVLAEQLSDVIGDPCD